MTVGKVEPIAPKVSVCMITYNQESYVSQAIESVLMQETTFAYELVVGEDNSTDGTREIVLRYQRERPDVVRVLCHAEKLGMLRNLATSLEACQGEYIALLEGDDYWTSATKLERQVEILDAHPETAICCHQATFVWEDGTYPSGVFPERRAGFFDLKDLLRDLYCFIPTCSALLRREAVPHLPPWYFQLKMGDWSLHVLTSRRGNIAFIAEPMGVYRIRKGSGWSSRSWAERVEAVAEAFERFDIFLDREYRPIIRETLFKAYFSLGLTAVGDGNLADARRWTRKCLAVVAPHRRFRDKLHLGLQAYAPCAFARLRALKRRVSWSRI